MKICFIETTWPHNSRTERFKESFRQEGNEIISIGWKRDLRSVAIDGNSFVKESIIGYGKPIKKLMLLGSFLLHSVNVIKSQRPDVLFMVHWDSLLIGMVCNFILRKKMVLVYDCLDMPTAKNRLVNIILLRLDTFLARKCDLVFFASRYFPEFYGIKESRECVFENYPSRKIVMKVTDADYLIKELPVDKKIISWLGVVRYFSVLKNLIDAVRNDETVHLCFFGDGPDLDRVIAYINNENITNVRTYGRYKFEDIGTIYKYSDLIWAAYPTDDFNVKYAISNKYFECNFFEKKPIFSKNTMIYHAIGDSGSALFVDEKSVDSIKMALSRSDDCFNRYEPVKFWEDEFKRIGELLNSTIKR
ncbi:hypothetical protein VCSRO151_2868 [Vibrio cholerae]|uniref:glycosyltransferase family 4 protein n=1 Tax=Vibrio TaxID=662 RepID=UPI00111C7C10|nr:MULTISPECIES: glycosyltransferase family 4 protein [Vibrio]TXX92815.1 glycosyltransferase family 4 protein [Vibrio cholerae]BCN18147.1 putative glycosyltransferase [Vibrio cholerae]GHW44145.1 hypothetical protein VCSRO151_2868 [Vibrio cholerae]